MKSERRHRNWLSGIIFLAVFNVHFSYCLAGNDSIYLGTQIKLDIASPVLVPAANKWQMQHYEIAANVRLAKRFYPTLELGYAGGKATQDTVSYSGQGGFFRAGCDINPLKKHPESPHALLVGVRLGTAFQDFTQDTELSAIGTELEYLNGRMKRETGGRADCWGEIVAGCQVEIAQVHSTSFYMGWMGRFKCLFTRSEGAIYIPGFGKRDNIGWGVNYYFGWRF